VEKTVFFEINEALNNEGYLFQFHNVSEGNVFIVISSPSDMYQTYFGLETYNKKWKDIEKILDQNGTLLDHSKSYKEYTCLIDKDFFITHYEELFEMQYLFKFSLFLSVNSDISNKELIARYKKFSFYSTFNFKRWMNKSTNMYFIDIEHQFCTEYIS
jgi:hypothetical protein